jgi:hypothetical protein
MQGAMLEGLRRSGAREPRIELLSFTEEDATFHALWRDDG